MSRRKVVALTSFSVCPLGAEPRMHVISLRSAPTPPCTFVDPLHLPVPDIKTIRVWFLPLEQVQRSYQPQTSKGDPRTTKLHEDHDAMIVPHMVLPDSETYYHSETDG